MPARLTVHDALGLSIPNLLPTSIASGRATVRRSALQLFRRGQFVDAIAASTDEEADRILDIYVEGLPFLPSLTTDQQRPFWFALARNNGCPQQSLWVGTRLNRPKANDLNAAIDALEADGLVFRLAKVIGIVLPSGNYVPSGHHHIYLSDVGIQRRLLASWHAEQASRAKENEGSPILTTMTTTVPLDHGWEGLVIGAIRSVLPSVPAVLFRSPADDEIDLVLRWPDGNFWAIEITRGNPAKKPRLGFTRIATQLAQCGLVTGFVVHTDEHLSPAAREHCEWLTLKAMLQRCLSERDS